MPRTIQQERRPNTCAVIRRLTFAFLLLSVNPALTHAAETIISGDVGPSVSEAGGHALAGSLAQASVEPSSGVLRTRLAILVPHARGGPQPGLALDYSSTAGTREAGVGWGLALPVIERSTQFGPPQYQDPTPDPNAAYTLDRFTFNGVPLVPLCMVGAKQACVTADSAVLPGWAGKGWMYFRLETDTASTRIFWSPDRFTWRVQVRGGEVLEFGNPLLGPFPGKPEDGLDFDVFLKGNTIQHKAFRWNLARRWEPAANGGQPVNRIVYVWQQLDDTGRGYLIDIYDTPPADSVPDRAPLDGYAHHTHLRWQRTPRVRNSIPPIWRMTFDQQVAGIDVTSKSWAKPAGARELVRRHHLTYIRQGEYSLLEGFQIEGRCASPVPEQAGVLPATACPRLPRTTLGYSQPEHNSTPKSALAVPGGFKLPNGASKLPLVLFDVNSDSLPDLIETSEQTTRTGGTVQRRAYVDNGFWHEERSIATDPEYFSKFGYTFTGDFAGTGASTAFWFLPPTPSPATVGASSLSSPRENKGIWDWAGISEPLRLFWDNWVTGDFWHVQTTGDIDGDGLPDTLDFPDEQNPVPGDPNWKKKGLLTTRLSRRIPRAFDTYSQKFFASIFPFGDKVKSCVGPSYDMMGELAWPDGARSVQLADMNGDSLSDLVVVGQNAIHYWTSDGRGNYGCSTRGASCTCSSPTTRTIENQMVSPDLGPDASPRRVALADVNGDGLADLVSATGDGVRIYLNLEGWTFHPPIFIPGFWFGRDWKKAIADETISLAFADMNGNGLNDVVVIAGDEISSFDVHRIGNIAAAFAPDGWAPRPGLLIDIDNGLGARTKVAYQSTADLVRLNLARQTPWAQPLPQILQVVQRLTVTTAEPGAQPIQSFYEYDDPAWDGWARRFRGFRKVSTTRLVGNLPLTTTQTFFIPVCPNSFCGSLDAGFQSLRAASGAPLVTEIFDDQHRYLSTVSRSYEVALVGDGPAGYGSAMRVAPTQVDMRIYDTTNWKPSLDVSTARITVRDGHEPLWSGPVPIRSRNSKLMRVSEFTDAHGTVTKRIEHGRITDDEKPFDDPITTITTIVPPRPDWKFLAASQHTDAFPKRPGVPDDQPRETRFVYDAGGQLIETHGLLSGTLPLQRRHEDPAAQIAPAAPAGSRDGVILLARYEYDDFGHVTLEETPNGRCAGARYDTAFAQLPEASEVYREGCGNNPLATIFQWDRGLEQTIGQTDPAGANSTSGYDGFGRLIATHAPDPATGQVQAAPSLQITYFDVPGGPVQRVRSEAFDGTGASLVRWLYQDGLGRPLVSLTQADPAAGDGGAWIGRGLSRRVPGGYVTGTFEPWFYNGDPANHPLTPPASAMTEITRDGFGRAIEVREPDGSLAQHWTFRPLTLETFDGANRRTTVELNGHGLLLQQSRYTATDVVWNTLSYTAQGQPSLVVQGHHLGFDTVLRWMRYDSFGRMVENAEPNTALAFSPDPANTGAMKSWRYAFNDNGSLVGTSDARGCGKNIYYDSVGRARAEDWSPCLRSQAAYTPPNLASAEGTEVLFQWDGPEPGQTADFGVASSNLNGRHVSTVDRAAHTRFAYDFRGRLTGEARQLARPSGAQAVWPNGPGQLLGRPASALPDPRYSAGWFRKDIAYDGFNRPVSASTGARARELQGAGDSRLSIGYSKRGLVTRVGGSYGTLLESAKYDAKGLPLERRLGDRASTAITDTYDPTGRPTGHRVSRASSSLWKPAPGGYLTPQAGDPPTTQEVLQDFTYGYDPSGLLNKVTDLRAASAWPSGAKPRSESFLYDDLVRLKQVDYGAPASSDAAVIFGTPLPEIPPSTLAQRVKQQTFRFDWKGNLITSGDDVSAFFDRSLGPQVHGGSASGPNRLTSAGNGKLHAAYDEAGNLVELDVDRTGTCSESDGRCAHRFIYDWDEVGELARARRWDFKVMPAAGTAAPATAPDADLRFRYAAGTDRVLRTAVLADGSQSHNAEIFDTLRLNGAAFNTTSDSYEQTGATEEVVLPGFGRVIHRPGLPGGGANDQHLLIELADHLGSTTSVIDRDTGELVEWNSYQLFGGTDSSYRPPRWGGLRADHGFTGHEEDGAVGLIYAGARYFLPALARWASADPLTVHGLGSDLNPYAYVSGQPSVSFDSTGLDGSECDSEQGCGDGSSGSSGDGSGVEAGPGDSSSGQPVSPPTGPGAPAVAGAPPANSGTLGGAAHLLHSILLETSPIYNAFRFAVAPEETLKEHILVRADLVAGVLGMNYSSVKGPIKHRDDIDPEAAIIVASMVPGPLRPGRLATLEARAAAAEARAAAAAERSAGASARNVNPIKELGKEGRTKNCVNCSVATDATLSGSPATALPSPGPVSIGVLERWFGASFGPSTTIGKIAEQMAAAGAGARGIVFGQRAGGKVGHVFNVINQQGVVRFVDGQTGKEAVVEGYTGFQLLRTQ